jgi:hypothetical protein
VKSPGTAHSSRGTAAATGFRPVAWWTLSPAPRTASAWVLVCSAVSGQASDRLVALVAVEASRSGPIEVGDTHRSRHLACREPVRACGYRRRGPGLGLAREVGRSGADPVDVGGEDVFADGAPQLGLGHPGDGIQALQAGLVPDEVVPNTCND